MKPLVFATALLLAASPVLAASTTLQVSKAWARPAPQGGNGAGYAVISNSGTAADKLTAASSPVAARIEIHESMVMNGQAMMHPRPGGLAVPAGGTAVLRPGGFHLMLMGLKQPLKTGEQFPVTLTFKKAGKQTIDFIVQQTPPAG
ncbi:MAG: copper chaperone PCu(A)C [Caulobacter sp.]|nr:copper chaperone PCu(A)C [Caulobacter sp.]